MNPDKIVQNPEDKGSNTQFAVLTKFDIRFGSIPPEGSPTRGRYVRSITTEPSLLLQAIDQRTQVDPTAMNDPQATRNGELLNRYQQIAELAGLTHLTTSDAITARTKLMSEQLDSAPYEFTTQEGVDYANAIVYSNLTPQEALAQVRKSRETTQIKAIATPEEVQVTNSFQDLLSKLLLKYGFDDAENPTQAKKLLQILIDKGKGALEVFGRHWTQFVNFVRDTLNPTPPTPVTVSA